MDRRVIAGLLVGSALAAAGMVMAGRTLTRPEYGEVVRVRARVEQVSAPRDVCRDVTNTRYVRTADNPDDGTSIGDRHGGTRREAAAVPGAFAEGQAGRAIDRRNHRAGTTTETTRQCRTIADVEERIAGYDVTYEVDGRRRTVLLDRDPGERVRLVEVEAISQGEDALAAR